MTLTHYALRRWLVARAYTLLQVGNHRILRTGSETFLNSAKVKTVMKLDAAPETRPRPTACHTYMVNLSSVNEPRDRARREIHQK